MLCRTFTLLIALLCFFQVGTTQVKETTNVNQVWAGYFNQTRFSKRFGTWTDLHLRTKEDFATNFSQGIVRLGLTYFAGDNTRITAGYAFVNHFPADNHPQISQPEHRPWQQVLWTTRYAKIRTSQFLRLEERWRRKIASEAELAEGYQFNYRIRYNFLLSVPLTKNAFQPNSLAIVFNDEVHINFGEQILYNYFDQNRFFLGFSYQRNKTDNLQFGYMNLFQQLPAGNRYRFIHALRIFYFQNLDLRKH
jgi:hypothetical protein